MAGFFLRNNDKPLTHLQEIAVILMDDIILSWKVDNKAMLTI